MKNNQIMIKPYSTRELSELFGISEKTLRTWIVPIKDKIGIKRGRFYNVNQTQIMFKQFGLPFEKSISSQLFPNNN
ncbi:MAG: hypothetical protein JST26_16800 [Bacteroidetes bacterium]|nr:hypothetical protein [Bacteroidota bacterium]